MTAERHEPDLGMWAKPTLPGKAVTLRPYVPRAVTDTTGDPADADAVWEMVNDAEGNDLTATRTTFAREQIEQWVDTRATAPDRLDLVVVEKATGDFAGEVVLNEYDVDRRSANFRIALRGPRWYGRGLGTEAAQVLLTHAFTDLQLNQVTLDVLERNTRARASYATLGFTETDRYEEDGESWITMALARR
ncbi:GNAT family N-acetyltransferase [Demequina sp. B12]|uniref:GNAT family N-acetyltransferase n=1 Tax=Demequina sp. B12 TaxID=2992757 RepID=UPI00237A908E|nr:GNAT family N-acetyltransferase [Demequina sp. B12]MDE0572748.1 GNAT family N-acetyltransferase [Demequina sp. B12]